VVAQLYQAKIYGEKPLRDIGVSWVGRGSKRLHEVNLES
jgi:hypothetical protein